MKIEKTAHRFVALFAFKKSLVHMVCTHLVLLAIYTVDVENFSQNVRFYRYKHKLVTSVGVLQCFDVN